MIEFPWQSKISKDLGIVYIPVATIVLYSETERVRVSMIVGSGGRYKHYLLQSGKVSWVFG